MSMISLNCKYGSLKYIGSFCAHLALSGLDQSLELSVGVLPIRYLVTCILLGIMSILFQLFVPWTEISFWILPDDEKDPSLRLGLGVSSKAVINYDTRTYSYKEIKGATNNFSSENKLDYGELGLLYKAILSADEIVAVKRATRESQQSHTDFQNGTYLSRLRESRKYAQTYNVATWNANVSEFLFVPISLWTRC